MKSLTRISALSLVLLALPAFAKDGVTNPAVKARMDTMQVIRGSMATLGDMASGKTTFDAARATEARSAMAGAAAQIVPGFQAPETDPVAEAAPAIWETFDDFSAKAENLVTAAEALNTASLDGLKSTLGPVAASCKSCHEGYRLSK
ncbi:c-type cytochrome [Falsigemmobacter intermedius]|uniref:Cytochrome c n=1 Tax=Falsigemmobacter intermedius TaxID=1553448 RepID=A0A3S3W091_9RHOB|nr:cytochrome c [Falsigemmobacter intermedius]RWY45455.1 cytochrome c [Falsigemmobacter intermedius]